MVNLNKIIVLLIFVLLPTFLYSNGKPRVLKKYYYTYHDDNIDDSKYLQNSNDIIWKGPTDNTSFKRPSDKHILWVRFQLDEVFTDDPTLFCHVINQTWNFYVDSHLYKQYGETGVQYYAFLAHSIFLPKYTTNTWFTFKISYYEHKIGILKSPYYGNRSAINSLLYASHLRYVILAFFFIGASLFALLLTFRNSEKLSLISLSLFFISLGVYLLQTNWIKLLNYTTPLTSMFIELHSLFLLPIGLLGYYRFKIRAPRIHYVSILHYTYILFFFYTVILSFIDPDKIIFITTIYSYFVALISATILVHVYYLVSIGHPYKIFALSMTALIIFVIHDVAMILGFIPWSRVYVPEGAFLFSIFLLIDIQNVIIASDRYLKTSSSLLRKQNSELFATNKHREKTLGALEAAQLDVLYQLSEMAELRSKETGHHVKRVTEYSLFLGSEIRLSTKELSVLKHAFPLHDLGKISTPDSILNKPDKLTDEEFNIIKSHSQIGYNILAGSERETFKSAAIIALQHHEKFNGKGYPLGLKGEKIHIYGRITAISDVFDALISDRCYKKAWEPADIYRLFEKEKGEHFDPNLTEIFLKNFDIFLKIKEKYNE